MADLTERLKLLLSLDGADKVVQGFQDTSKSADKDLGNTEKKLDKLGGTMTKTGAGAVAFAGVVGTGVLKTVGSFNDLAIEAGKGADATGLAVDEWSRWIEVAGDVGVEAGTIQGAFQKFNKSVADGKPALDEYGVAIAHTKDGVVDANASFINAIDTIGKIEDPTKRAAAAQELFGKSYGEISELIETGADGVKTALAAVSETKVIDDGELDKARDYRASMDALSDAAGEFALAVGQGATPVVQGFADVASKAIGAVSSLDQVTGGAAGQFLAIGTAGIAAVGGLSLVVGQVVKMRTNLKPLTDRLHNTEGGLSGMGKAATVAGTALGALAAVEVAGQVFNTVTDAAGRNERSLQQLTITLGDYQKGQADATTVLDDFQKKVSDTGSTFALGNVIKNFGKEINLVNAEGESFAYNIETIDEAFQNLLDTSPQQAELLVQALRDQAQAMGENAYEFDGYIQLADRYQERVDLQVKSTEALTTAADGNTTATQANAAAQGEGATAAEDHTQHLAWLYSQMEDGVRSANEAASAQRDLALADKEAAQAAATHQGAIANLQGQLDDKTAWLNLQGQFADTNTAIQSGLEAWRTKADNAAQAVLEGDLALTQLQSSVAEYATTVLGLPSDVVTDMVGSLADPSERQKVLDFLKNLSYGVTVPVNYQENKKPAVVVPGKGGAYADGGFTGRGNPNDVAGIVHKGEYVIPADGVDQSSGLPLAGASGGAVPMGGGGVGGGATFIVNVAARAGQDGYALAREFREGLKQHVATNGPGEILRLLGITP
jgi:hypothetical protein